MYFRTRAGLRCITWPLSSLSVVVFVFSSGRFTRDREHSTGFDSSSPLTVDSSSQTWRLVARPAWQHLRSFIINVSSRELIWHLKEIRRETPDTRRPLFPISLLSIHAFSEMWRRFYCATVDTGVRLELWTETTVDCQRSVSARFLPPLPICVRGKTCPHWEIFTLSFGIFVCFCCIRLCDCHLTRRPWQVWSATKEIRSEATR